MTANGFLVNRAPGSHRCHPHFFSAWAQPRLSGSPLFQRSKKEEANCMTEVRVGNIHNIPRCATAQHCQAILSRTTVCKNKKKQKQKKRQKDNWGFYFAASCSFCLCVPFMTIVITFTAELKNRQNFCKRLGKLIRDKLHGLFGADNSAHIKHLLAI